MQDSAPSLSHATTAFAAYSAALYPSSLVAANASGPTVSTIHTLPTARSVAAKFESASGVCGVTGTETDSALNGQNKVYEVTYTQIFKGLTCAANLCTTKYLS